ncbi:hypothetical protein [Flagellimonas onchidii]|uniref:hypothetical protein n=1 Tax=Flagellimonas onchidii TaxID=2562684 RepID=UPI0010A5E8B0|nr:hypothetical protein [Allomuricauda onchidii]
MKKTKKIYSVFMVILCFACSKEDVVQLTDEKKAEEIKDAPPKPQDGEAGSRPDMGKNAKFHDTEHFRFHYTEEGDLAIPKDNNDGNDVPDVLDMYGKTFEGLWTRYITDEGWNEPPSDGTVGGGDGLIDIYLNQNGHIATVSIGKMVKDNPKTTAKETTAATAFMNFTNFQYAGAAPSDEGQYAVLASHEFHHIIQFGYFSDEDDKRQWGRWLNEATSTWIEDAYYAHTPQNDYKAVFYATDACLIETDPYNSGIIEGAQRGYKMALFLDFLKDTYGKNAIKELWDHTAQNKRYEIFNAVAKSWNTSRENLFIDFALALMGRDFKEKTNLPTVRLEGTINLKDTPHKRFQPSDGVGSYGFDLVEIVPNGKTAKIEFSNFGNNVLKGYVLGINTNNKTLKLFKMDNHTILNTNDYTQIYAMVYNFEIIDAFTDCLTASYSYSMEVYESTETQSNTLDHTFSATWFNNFKPLLYSERIDNVDYFAFLNTHNEAGVPIKISEFEAERIPSTVLDGFDQPITFKKNKAIDNGGYVADDAQEAYILKYIKSGNDDVFYYVSSSPTETSTSINTFKSLIPTSNFEEETINGVTLHIDEQLGVILFINKGYYYNLEASNGIDVKTDLQRVAASLL